MRQRASAADVPWQAVREQKGLKDMDPLVIVVIVLVAIFAIDCLLYVLWLLAMRPFNERREEMLAFADLAQERLFAHRGLFDNGSGQDAAAFCASASTEEVTAPENSLPAFARAAEAGFGIELDVQLSSDGRLVVFHDDTMQRTSGLPVRITQASFDDLSQVPLFGSACRIPLFSEVLEVVDGRVPIICEIKVDPLDRDIDAICEKTFAALESYGEPCCIESFDPWVVLWFRQHHPDVLRGQLSTGYQVQGNLRERAAYRALSDCLRNGKTKPDFIAYNRNDTGRLAFRLMRYFWKGCTVAWTIKDRSQLKDAGFEPETDATQATERAELEDAHSPVFIRKGTPAPWSDFDVFIFDSFVPPARF